MEEEQLKESFEKYINEALAPCVKCHLCNTVCPVLDVRVTQGPFGISRAIHYALKWDDFDENLRNLVFSCTTCGKCVATCEHVARALPLVQVFEKAREYLIAEKKLGHMPGQNKVLKDMYTKGNPWGYSSRERTQWAEGLNIKFASKDNKGDVLYYVGCVCSYDPRCQKIAKNLTKIFKQAGINFGILEKETCSGSEARRMGEAGLFEFLSEANMRMFKEAGIKHIVTGDPHGFYSFSNEYPSKESNLKVQHYTQFINELMDQGKLKLSSKVNKKVTYHDPCYLGRHSGVYEEPRKLIKRIPGLTLVEMENNKADSNCCGMGGGRMWMEPPKKGFVTSQAIAEKRVQQGLDTGAEILLTACPFCNITLTDAVKALAKEDSIKVMDITELIVMSL